MSDDPEGRRVDRRGLLRVASAVGLSLIAVFGLSLVFGWLHARTDDIVAPTAVHGGYNCLVFCLLYLVGV